MRQVRRKTVDPAARTYLLKAKGEGIGLSWNKYEKMLPQDGFGLLGLNCHECLQGPCRLNPFQSEEAETVCGLGKDELVLNWLQSQIAKDQDLLEMANALISELPVKEAMASKVRLLDLMLSGQGENVQKLALEKVELVNFINELIEKVIPASEVNSYQIGLGVLERDGVNVCLEGLSPLQLTLAQEVAKEMKDEAVNRGAAKGFSVVLVGDISPNHNLKIVTNEGSVELALLTGLVDLYVTGQRTIARGKNVSKKYHGASSTVSTKVEKAELKQLFLQAAIAYTQRDAAKIKESDQLQEIKIDGLDTKLIKANLEQGVIKGICILGGGSNVKAIGDDSYNQVATRLSDENILCLTYGNAAVTLSKYGSEALIIGGELQVGKLVELVKELASEKVVAVFPELTHAKDLQAAFALSATGAKVLSGIKLPVDGSKLVAEEMQEIIEYCEAKELANRVVELTGK